MTNIQTDKSPVRFLRNAWYVAGYSQEIEDDGFLARTVLNVPLLILRSEDGTVTAIQDRCPHRFVPLHRGVVENGRVTCGYHGIAFDGLGNCVKNPHGTTAGLSVQSYAMAEVHGILWVWMGERAEADLAALPRFEQIDEADFHVRRGYLHGNANYELMTDNILDLSHIEFLHPALGSEAVSKAKVDVEQQGDVIVTSRRMTNELLPEGLSKVYKSGGQRVDREMKVTWQAPANMVLQVTVDPADNVGDWRTATQTLHLFTPETAYSTHYFYVGSISRATGSSEIADKFGNALGLAFLNEDKPMIDAQAERIGHKDIMELKPKLLGIDKASVLARRKLASMIKAELAS